MNAAGPTDPSRRLALAALGAAAAGVALSGCAGGAAAGGAVGAIDASAAPAPVAAEPARRISLAQWSLHRSLRAGAMTNLDFPKVARGTYGIGAVEFVSTFFAARVADDAYLRELRGVADGEGVRCVLIMVDGEGELGAADPAARRDAVERHVRWLHAAKALGCFAIRVNARSEGMPEQQLSCCTDGIGALADRGRDLGLDVIVENHGGVSSNGGWMAELMRRIGRANCGTLPDFGNFKISPTEQYDRYKGVAEMLPWARDVSAKSYGFDASGNETTIDYARMFKVLDDAGYRGWMGIEFEGKTMSEHDGILATKRLIERLGARA